MKSGYLFILPLLILTIGVICGCGDCKDCGPSQDYPYFKVRFFNIDSLIKVNASITETQDSLTQLIDSGYQQNDTAVISVRNKLRFLDNVQSNIRKGKIKIAEVEGTGTDKILLFRDSLTNDSLISFNFPLSMSEDKSEFIVHIADRKDTLSVSYQVITKSEGHSILRRAYGINIITCTYDSIKVSCKSDTCLSNETTLYAYF